MGHTHTEGANKKVLWIGFLITTSYMLIEAVGGLLTNSLALLSDAGHMLSDSVSLGVGILAFSMGEKSANLNKTYGYKRFEILAALFNGATLIIIAIYIYYAASKRFFSPPEIASGGMLVIAIIGLLVNIVVASVMMRGDIKGNLNVRAAFLHVLGDLIGSIGAIIAALFIIFLDWGWADPLASVLVATLILVSGWRVTKEAVHVLMEGTPKNINVNDIIHTIEKTDGVISIHDLHIWSITSRRNALSCHAVVASNLTIEKCQQMLRDIELRLKKKHINHITIQMETNKHPHDESVLCQNDNRH